MSDTKPDEKKELPKEDLDKVAGGTMGQRPTMPTPPPVP
jgi:hypothetical protein